jgi:hypothetical protein
MSNQLYRKVAKDYANISPYLPMNGKFPHEWWQDNMVQDLGPGIFYGGSDISEGTEDLLAEIALNYIQLIDGYSNTSFFKKYGAELSMFVALTCCRSSINTRYALFTIPDSELTAEKGTLRQEVANQNMALLNQVNLDVANRDESLQVDPTDNGFVNTHNDLVEEYSIDLGIAYAGFVALYVSRLGTKPYSNLANSAERMAANFGTLYGVFCSAASWNFEADTVRAMKEGFSLAHTESVAYFIQVCQSWVSYASIENNIAAEKNKGILEASIIQVIIFNGMPVLGFLDRALLYLNANVSMLFSKIYGHPAFEEGLYHAIATYALYLMKNGPERTAMLARLSIANPPNLQPNAAVLKTNGALWKFARFFKPACMSALGSKGNETLILYLIKLHDKLNPANKIMNQNGGYRSISATVVETNLDLMVEETVNEFNTLKVTNDSGDILKRAAVRASEASKKTGKNAEIKVVAQQTAEKPKAKAAEKELEEEIEEGDTIIVAEAVEKPVVPRKPRQPKSKTKQVLDDSGEEEKIDEPIDLAKRITDQDDSMDHDSKRIDLNDQNNDNENQSSLVTRSDLQLE